MLMNAPPRAFSNDARSFISTHGLDLSYRRLPDMTNNGRNAWGVSGPVASSVPVTEDWIYGFGDASNTGTYSDAFAPASYSDGFDALPPYTDAQITSQMRAVLQSGIEARGETSSTTSISNQSEYSLENRKFMEGTDPRNSNNGQIVSTAAPASPIGPEDGISSNTFPYNRSPNIGPGNLNSFSEATSFSSIHMHGLLSMRDRFKDDKTSPGSVSFETELEPCVLMPACVTTLALHENSAVEKWWHEPVQRPSDLGTLENGLPFLYDGLPDQAFNAWPTEPTSTPQWTKQVMPIATVSPQALTLESSPSSSFSSPSISSRQHSGTKPRRNPPPASRDSFGLSSGNNESPIVSRTAVTRQKLLSEPKSRPHVQTLFNNHNELTNGDKARPPNSRAKTHVNHEATIAQNSEVLRKIRPKIVRAGVHENNVMAKAESRTMAVVLHREARNEFLIGSRLMGVPYREIRRQGGFTEAESTLRGRFRTLTKEKSERVRKPEWGERDMFLLEKAVCKLSDPEIRQGRVPWKKVANYIFEHGGSYHFGNSTCRKKWDEIQAQSEKK